MTMQMSRKTKRRFMSCVASVVTHLYRMEQAEMPNTRMRLLRREQRARLVRIAAGFKSRAEQQAANDAVRAEWQSLKPEIVA